MKHVYPIYEAPGDVELSRRVALVWLGKMRIVRSRKRMRKLKRRGVPMLHLGYGDGTAAQLIHNDSGELRKRGPWAWFVEDKPLTPKEKAARVAPRLSVTLPILGMDFGEGHDT